MNEIKMEGYAAHFMAAASIKDFICATIVKEDEKVHQINQDLYSPVTLIGIWQITNCRF